MDAHAATPDLPPLPAPPAWLAEEAWILEPPPTDELRHVMRDEAGILLDRLLVRVARGHGALDVAIGEGLASLATGDRALRVGYSGIGDYARERLDIAPRTAQAMARLARELRAPAPPGRRPPGRGQRAQGAGGPEPRRRGRRGGMGREGARGDSARARGRGAEGRTRRRHRGRG